MIVVDTSALAAILFAEPDRRYFASAITESAIAYVAAPNAFELMMVAFGRLGQSGRTRAVALLGLAPIVIVPWDERHAGFAIEAFERFGKGRSNAKLNFGDCMAYALAKSLGAPLLFKGEDFRRTDIASAA